MDVSKDEGLYLNRTFLAALLTLCIAVLCAAAKAYVDVVEIKTEVKGYSEDVRDLKIDIKEVKEDVKSLLRR